jgi:hypothetical protein
MMQMNKIQSTKFDESWSRWDLGLSAINGVYYITGIESNPSYFKIKLEQESTAQCVEVLFSGFVSAFRFVDEGLRLKLYSDLSEKYGADFYHYWTFFEVKNSDYLQWLAVQSYTVSDFYELRHFVIMGSDCMLDIVTACEPEVIIIQD